MNRVIKKILTYLIIAFIIAVPAIMNAQPTPGDTNLGSLHGGVVGGGADLSDNISLWIIPALVYLFYKWKYSHRKDEFSWNWGE